MLPHRPPVESAAAAPLPANSCDRPPPDRTRRFRQTPCRSQSHLAAQGYRPYPTRLSELGKWPSLRSRESQRLAKSTPYGAVPPRPQNRHRERPKCPSSARETVRSEVSATAPKEACWAESSKPLPHH